jgi:hypothetical protein
MVKVGESPEAVVGPVKRFIPDRLGMIYPDIIELGRPSD